MNLICIIHKGKTYVSWCHSNFHHLKIIKAISDHFRYNFLGCEVGKKNEISLKELMDKIKKNSNPYESACFEQIKDLRYFDKETREYGISGYILINLGDKRDMFSHNELFINLGTTEDDRGKIWEEFRERYSIFNKRTKSTKTQKK